MKQWKAAYIQQAEIMQLVLLATLYGQRESKDLFFQGGTAIRWCYGGNRFSEDLDFETSLATDTILTLFSKAMPSLKRAIAASLGSGALELKSDACSGNLCTVWARYSPPGRRGKIAVKLEFQQIRPDLLPETQLMILGTLPEVADLIRNGLLRIDLHAILAVQTLAEILAGKIRALLERKFYKGRDFWDIWFLCYSLQVSLDARILARKLEMYPFTQRRGKAELLEDLNRNNGSIHQAINDDLKRFVPPQVFAAIEQVDFQPLVTTVRELISKVPDDIII